MSLPGLLIEYLVVGAMALLWILPLANTHISAELPLERIAVVAPAIYVVGMFIDFIAYFLLSFIPTRKHSLKTLARRISHRKADIRDIENMATSPAPGESTRRRIWFQVNAPDIAKEIKERSSRDRIARGALVNFLFIWIVSLAGEASFPGGISSWFWLGMTILFLLIWMFFEGNSYAFEIRASSMVPKPQDDGNVSS